MTTCKASTIFNFNVGILGHVDSGKTSLARALSTTASTAAFDKHPQSRERGITLDLGFSSFSLDMSDEEKEKKKLSHFPNIQITLVDCPGHASLIRTVIGGAQIIDLVILVIDATKGVQTQTAECLLLAQITCPHHMIMVINKIDLIPEENRQNVLSKMFKRLRKTVENTTFKDCPIISVAAAPSATGDNPALNLSELLDVLRQNLYYFGRSSTGKFVMAVDHCFGIRGQGTVLTGTVLSGRVRIGDELSLPSLGEKRKVKSMQIFRTSIDQAIQGDRVGVCVTQFDSKQFERGIVCEEGAIPTIYGAIVSFNSIPYFKPTLTPKSRFHISIGHETVMANCSYFEDVETENRDFSFDNQYAFVPEIESGKTEKRRYFVVLQFEHAILCPAGSIYIASRLDTDIHTNTCRLAFHGRLIEPFLDKSYVQIVLPLLKVFKNKERQGTVERLLDDYTVIVNSLFKKETNLDLFVGLKVHLSTGEMGHIESGFGQSGKVRIRIPSGLSPQTLERLQNLNTGRKKGKAKEKDITPQNDSEAISVVIYFKRYIYDPKKAMIQ